MRVSDSVGAGHSPCLFLHCCTGRCCGGRCNCGVERRRCGKRRFYRFFHRCCPLTACRTPTLILIFMPEPSCQPVRALRMR